MTNNELQIRLTAVKQMEGISEALRFTLMCITYQSDTLLALRKKMALAKAENDTRAYESLALVIHVLQQTIYSYGEWVYKPMPANTPRSEYRNYSEFVLNSKCWSDLSQGLHK